LPSGLARRVHVRHQLLAYPVQSAGPGQEAAPGFDMTAAKRDFRGKAYVHQVVRGNAVNRHMTEMACRRADCIGGGPEYSRQT
jgi:hypothetical protein